MVGKKQNKWIEPIEQIVATFVSHHGLSCKVRNFGPRKVINIRFVH